MDNTKLPAATWESIDSLVPWDKNPRKNDGAPVEAVAGSLRRFGWGSPLLVREETRQIVAGHTRWKAAQSLGMAEVPVRFVDLDEHEAAALALADNKLGEMAEWDDDVLSEVLAELSGDGVDLDGLGWSEDELAAIIAEAVGDGEDPDPPGDEVPEVQEDVDSEAGCVYELGPHRLMCGDSTDLGVWAALMQGEKARAVWTDPPYGVAYVGKTADALTIENDDLDEEGLASLLAASLDACLNNCEPGAAWYVAAPPGPLHYVFATVLGDLGVWRWTLMWVKDRFVLGRADYHHRHEPIFYGWKPGAAHYFIDDRTQDTVFEVPRPSRNPDHPTMKPIELVSRQLANSTKPGWIVADPFGGSGTTLLACAGLRLRCRTIELDPKYCDVIRRRWTRYALANGLDPGSGALE